MTALMKPFDWQVARAQFPILSRQVNGRPLVYLDSAASAQKPRAVIDAMVASMEGSYANVHRGLHTLANETTDAYEAARRSVAGFIKAPNVDTVVFTKGATEAINLVASSFGLGLVAGDEIVLTETEHHANLVPWHFLRERKGVVLRFVPMLDDGSLDLEAYHRLLGPKTRMVAFSHISNVTGTVAPVKAMVEAAHAAGALTLVDGAQGIVHAAVDVQDLDCDFYVFSAHKLYGPTGIGVLYGKAETLAALPPYQGGGEMILSVDYQKSSYKQPPHRFEAGTPDISGVIALHTALDYLDAIGREAIFRHDQELAQYTYQRLAELPNVRLFGPATDRAGLVSFLLGDVHAHDVVTVADQRGVALRGGHHCNQPLMKRLGVASTARASFYFYNTRAEVDRFIEVVREIQKFFAV